MNLRQIKSNMTQLDIPSKGVSVLFSYETPVAAYCHGNGVMRTSTKYSATTTKHINHWLNNVMNVAHDLVEEVNQATINDLVADDHCRSVYS